MRAKQTTVHHFSKYVRTDKPHISNSYLTNLKRGLLGEPQYMGSEHHLVFGTEHHKRALEPSELPTVLERDEHLADSMSRSFRVHPATAPLLANPTEVEYCLHYMGVLVLAYIDIDTPADVFDLKGTKCNSWDSFFKSARDYDYFRQAALYKGVTGKPCTFLGQGKEAIECEPSEPGAVEITPGSWVRHEIYPLPTEDYPNLLKEGRDELHYLIDIHKHLRKYYEQIRPKPSAQTPCEYKTSKDVYRGMAPVRQR
jgi:hypothetical protein